MRGVPPTPLGPPGRGLALLPAVGARDRRSHRIGVVSEGAQRARRLPGAERRLQGSRRGAAGWVGTPRLRSRAVSSSPKITRRAEPRPGPQQGRVRSRSEASGREAGPLDPPSPTHPRQSGRVHAPLS